MTLALVCGSFLGFLPGAGALTVNAAGTQTVSGGDAQGTLVTPTNVGWSDVYGSGLSVNKHMEQGEYGSYTTFVVPWFDGYDESTTYEYEFYLDGTLKKTIKSNHSERMDVSVMHWFRQSDGTLTRGGIGFSTEGKWKYRVRAVSADGTSYSEWSEFSWEYDNSMAAFQAWEAKQGGGSADSGHEDADNTYTADNADDEDNSGDSINDIVTSSSGEVMKSAAAANVTSSIPAVVRTSQADLSAAAAGAVGGLKEGQYAMVNIGDSQCGELARQAVTNAASSVNGKVASYLEITLDICKEGEAPLNVTQLSSAVEFTLGTPADIDGNQYDFAVVRLHGDGRVDILPDLDSDPATITFQTDRFSVYAVIYGPKGSFKSSGKDNVPKTGDSAIPAVPFAIVGGICAVAALLQGKKARS